MKKGLIDMRGLKALYGIVWGLPTVFLLLLFGLYFAYKLRRRGILNPISVFKYTFGSLKKGSGEGLSPLSALATALGGTVGVGSITGVALAITAGGAGSIFWLWVCSFIGLFTKYAEVYIAHKHRKKRSGRIVGGAMHCLSDIGFKRTAALFSMLCVFASFGGGAVQSSALSAALTDAGIKPYISAALISLCLLTVIFGGQKSIAKFNSAAIPFFSLSFVIICGAFLCVNYQNIPNAFAKIFSEAFGFRQASSGFSAAMLIRAVKVGTARGTFSHEAGMGSSAIAHSAAEENSPHIQGLWGVSEVFIDSFVVSTLTALCVICADSYDIGALFGSYLGIAGKYYFTSAIAVFAFAAIISWCYYSETALDFLFPHKRLPLFLFRVLTVITAFFGALISSSGAFEIADLFNGLMIFPNLFLLYKLRSEITCAGKA